MVTTETDKAQTPSQLRLLKAVPEGERTRTFLKAEPVSPSILGSGDKPTLVVLPGGLVDHTQTEKAASSMAADLKMLGSAGLAHDIHTVVVTYPKHSDDPALFKQTVTNSRGPAGNQFSPLAEQLSSAMLGDVKDFSTLSPQDRTQETQRLQKALGSKVVTGMSTGTVVAEGLENAMVHQLQGKNIPPDVIKNEIMPHVKIVTHAEIAVQTRDNDFKPTGATTLRVMNNTDQVAARAKTGGVSMGGQSDIIRLPIVHEETGLARTDNNSAVLKVTLPPKYDIPSSGEKGLTNPNGHEPEPFRKSVAPSSDIPLNEVHGLDYVKVSKHPSSPTEQTGHAVPNALRGMMRSAQATAATPEGAPVTPPKDILAITTHYEKPLAGAGDAVKPRNYETVMKSLVANDGQVLPMQKVLEGGLARNTPLLIETPQILAKSGVTTHLDNGFYQVDLTKMTPEERVKTQAYFRETGVITQLENGGAALGIVEENLPRDVKRLIDGPAMQTGPQKAASVTGAHDVATNSHPQTASSPSAKSTVSSATPKADSKTPVAPVEHETASAGTSKSTINAGKVTGLLAGANRTINGKGVGEKVMGGIEIAGSGASMLKNAKGAGEAGMMITAADGVYEVGKATVNAVKTGKGSGKAVLTAIDTTHDVAITAGANFITAGIIGGSAHVLYQRTKEDIAESGAVLAKAGAMVIGKQEPDGKALMADIKKIQEKDRAAGIEALKATTPVWAATNVVNAVKEGSAMMDQLKASKAIAHPQAADKTEKAASEHKQETKPSISGEQKAKEAAVNAVKDSGGASIIVHTTPTAAQEHVVITASAENAKAAVATSAHISAAASITKLSDVNPTTASPGAVISIAATQQARHTGKSL
jgi:hypothetical protein